MSITPVQIGDCTLYCGDCLEILPTLEAGSINCIVTSPPYNHLSQVGSKPSGMWARRGGGLGWLEAWKANGYADNLDEPEYQQWQNHLFAVAGRAMAANGSLFYNHQIRWRDKVVLHPVEWFKPSGWRLRQEIVWLRSGGMMMNARMFCRFDERILWFTRGQWKWNQSSVGLGTVWKIATAQHKEHPVAFPVELPKRCIEATTDREDVVLDPFAGSGTTGVACVKTGRKFIGIEKEPKYFDIACRRIEQAYADQALFGVDAAHVEPLLK